VTTFFIGCFAFGLLFTVTTFLLGAFGGTDIHAGAHGLFSGLTGSHGAHAHGSSASQGHDSTHVSPFSLSTLSAFLTWFGGAGYLLSRYSALTALSSTLAALACGTVGGALFFAVVAKYIVPRLTVMDPDDFRVQGVVARVTSTIQPGGIGEIVYTLGGTRHSDGARSASERPIERGTQVVVLRIEKGIAFVEPWATFADTHQLPAGDAGLAEKSPQ
jgi:membrane protein implicated in regulation of membrane protease activity